METKTIQQVAILYRRRASVKYAQNRIERIKKAKDALSDAQLKNETALSKKIKYACEEAFEAYKEVIEFVPESTEIQLVYANAALKLKCFSEATAAISIVLSKSPENTQAKWLKAQVEYHRDIQVALQIIKEILSEEPSHKYAHNLQKKIEKLHNLKEKGNRVFSDKNYPESIKIYTVALEEEDPPQEFSSVL